MKNKKAPKADFKKKKENTLNSLKEVECFLNRTSRYFKINSISKFFKK